MSDSDSELLQPNRVFAFQNESTIVSARGPNVNTSNLTGISFRHNVLTSTMNLPRNYEWQKQSASNYDQRSMGYRRGTSPTSIASACDARLRNSSYINNRGMSSQRSVYNGRAGSPMSTTSMGSNATISAIDFVRAIKTNQLSNSDMRIIKEACEKHIKQKARNRIEKRRKHKLTLKGYRRKSGYDSGELGSNSSLSSDDNRSTRTSNYKHKMSSCRSTKTDVADFRRSMKNSNMFDDCTDYFRQNKMQGVVGRPANLNSSKSSITSFRSQIENPTPTKSMPPPVNFSKAQSSMTQQDRFKNNFLLPSQRFNRSVAALSIPEGPEIPYSEKPQNGNSRTIKNNGLSRNVQEQNSDDEVIFSELTAIERPAINQRKRSVESDDDDICLPVCKKPKVASPCKNMSQSFKNSTVIEKTKNYFEFAKPAFPVKKFANIKAKEKMLSTTDTSTTEKLISKSRGTLSDTIIQPSLLPKQVNTISQPKKAGEEQTEKTEDIELSSISQNKSDLSMRPSFIKRKLFTQNMDVTKQTEILAANSPQNSIYGSIQKERNKTRKLVSSQYCLSRDIQSDENNLLDLIHKIVPAESMNATNQTNKITVQNSMSENNDDKWDITSIISVRNNDDDRSDTFTDEDTGHADGHLQASPKLTRKTTPQKLVIGKKVKNTPPKPTRKVLTEENGTPKNATQECKKFWLWDADFESDVEHTPNFLKSKLKENKGTENKLEVQNVTLKDKFRGFPSKFTTNKTSLKDNTVDSVQKVFNNTNKSFRLCSHRNTKPNTNETAREKVKDYAKPCIEPQSKKQRATKSNIEKNKQENSKQEKLKQGSKKSPTKNAKTNTPQKTKEREPKEQTIKNNKTLRSAEKNKQPIKKTETVQSKAQKNKKEITEKSTTENKTHIKKSGTSQNKKEVKKPNSTKPQSNKPKDTCIKRNNQKEKILLDTTADSNKSNNILMISQVRLSRPSDSSFYRNSFAIDNKSMRMRPVRSCRNSFVEPNNNKSSRPVRSCRNSKHNDSSYSR